MVIVGKVAMALTVLLVDDEPMIVRALTRILARAGHTVIGCVEAGAAIDFARGTQPIEVLITDLHLGKTDGRDLARAVLEHHPDARVIVLSGEDPSAYESIHLARMHTLQKPVCATRLLAALEPAKP